MYKFLIPLFALALLASCTGTTPSPTDSMNDDTEQNSSLVGFDGKILEGKHTVVLHTSKGDIKLELNADAAPKTVTNFLTLAQTGYYDGLTFHRVIPEFMIQGGDPNGNGTGGNSVFGDTFEDEINAKSYDLHKQMLKDIAGDQQLPPQMAEMTVEEFYASQGYQYDDKLKSLPMDYGYIAMANRGPNTNGSQFFIITRDEGTDWLNGKHTVFGRVTEGMDIAETIATTDRDGSDQPLTPVTYTVEVLN